LPLLACSPEYWRAIPPEFVQQLQQQGIADENDILMEMKRLSATAQISDYHEQADSGLPPQAQLALQQAREARKLLQPSPAPFQFAVSPRLVETFTRLAGEQQF